MRRWAAVLKYRVLEILRRLGEAHVRQICCLLNGKPYDFCYNVDGRGGHCVYWYRRPRHESQRIRLVKPPCRHSPLYLIRLLREMERRGLLERRVEYRRDPLSKWGKDRFVIYSIRRGS